MDNLIAEFDFYLYNTVVASLFLNETTRKKTRKTLFDGSNS
jgi:hypothetical protein